MRVRFFVLALLLCLVPAFAITNTVFSDVDGDGDLDVFLETYLENNGSMSFIVRNVSSGIPQLTGVTQGYFVNVGFGAPEDLYIVRSGLQNLLYLSSGNGSFTNATGTALGIKLTGAPSVNTGTVFADFDSDGDNDSFVNGQFYVTNGSFANLNCTSESNLGELPGMKHMYAADMNGDLTRDIVGVTVAGATRLMLNVGDTNNDDCPEFYEAQEDVQLDLLSGVNFISVDNVSSGVAINDTLTYYPFSGLPAPFMADNFTDLYFARTSANVLAVQIWPETPVAYSAGGGVQFALPRFADKSYGSGVNISAVTTSSLIADFDSNGFKDILVGGAASNSNIYLRNFSSWNQTFVLDTTTGLPSIANMKLVQAADLDSDSALDLAIIDAQQICDGTITSAGTSTFQTTGSPGMSADPGPGGASVSDVSSDLILSSQLDNIVLSSSSPFIVFIDAFEIAVNALTGHSIVTGGNFDCSLVTLASEPAPNMTVSVTGLPATVVQGNDITYTIDLTPTTSVPQNVVVTNTYPAGVTYSSAVPVPTTLPGTWDVGDLTGLSTITITASTVGAPLGIATDTILVTWEDESGNLYSYSTTVNNDIVSPNSTSLTITKSAPATATAGNSITYTIDISLTSGNASDLNISDVLPPGVTFVSASPANTSAGPTWALGDYVAPASIQVNVTVSINGGTSGTITNTATVEFENSTGGVETVGDSADTVVSAPVSSAAAGGGGGGGFSRLQQLLIVDKVTVNNMGDVYVIDGLSFGDDLRIAGVSLSNIRFDGYVLANDRLQKSQSVLVQLGNIKQTGLTDANGRFSLLVPNLLNLVQSDQNKALPIWFSPRMSEYPSGDPRIGATYAPEYVDNPTLNFITPYPGLEFPGEFEDGVWFNGVRLSPVQGLAPSISEPSVPTPGEMVPETPPSVSPPVVTPPSVVEPEVSGLFSGIFGFIGEIINNVIDAFTPTTPEFSWYDFNGPADGVGIDNLEDLSSFASIVPVEPPFAEPYVPETPPGTTIPEPETPAIPGTPLGCSLSCKNQGDQALFIYNPSSPLCPYDFTIPCNKPWTGPTSVVSGVDQPQDLIDFIEGQRQACCSQPVGTTTDVTPPPETPPEEPGVPPPEIPKCKLVCDLSGNTAKYSYVPTGNLDCKADFTVSCGYAGETPKYEPNASDPQAGDADSINDILDECCAGLPASTTGPPAGPDGGGGDGGDGAVPPPGPRCGQELEDVCEVGMALQDIYVRYTTYPPGPPLCPADERQVLYTCDSKTKLPVPVGKVVADVDMDALLECCGAITKKPERCEADMDVRCAVGGGKFIVLFSPGGGDPPCPNPDYTETILPCGATAREFSNPLVIWVKGADGRVAPQVTNIFHTLSSLVGQKNYDECCGADSSAAAFYAEDCVTSATQSACNYYSNYKGEGLPFFRYNSVKTSGSTCVEESLETNYEQCVCADMLQEYGACNSAELNTRASVSYEASIVRSTCCPSAFVPGTQFVIPEQPPSVVPPPLPPPETPPVETPPPTVPPVETPPPSITPIERPIVVPRVPPAPTTPPPAINPNPPPALDFCVPADATAGVQTEIISNDEARTILDSSEAAFPEEYVPQDYDLIESVRVDACQSQQLAFKRSISNVYQEVRVFRCQNGVCSWVSDETQTDASCEGESLERLVSEDISRVLEVSQMSVVTTVGEEVTSNDRTINTGLYNVEFTSDLPSGVVSLGRPDGRVTLPRNTGLVLVGTPLVITVESAPSKARITLPVTPIESATSYSVFGLIGSGWIEVGGEYDPSRGVIVVDVNNFNDFVKNNKAVFAVMAYTAHEKSDSCVMMHEGNNDELIVLVHGFTSNKNTWNPLVTQAKINNEPYDIVAFQYSPDDTTDSAAQSLMSCLSTVAGNYKRYNIVAHSVGAVITNKALGRMSDNPDAYPTVYTVEKVISLGMPNKGIDVFVMNRLADVLANYPSVASVFDRRSIIAQELVNPEWSNLTVAPEWAQHIGVAGTVDCDFSQLLSDVTDRPSAGGAFNIIDPIQRFTRANDCVVTVKNALEHIPNQELCSNTFTPNVWHIALNDDSKVRQLIFYLINQEKAKADPTRGFAGYNQYVSWVDGCAPGTVYGIVGKKATAQKPLFCNCGDGVCDATIGETENSCPIDCYGWNMFLCSLLKNLSNLLLLLFGAGFLTYVVRKHAMNKQVNSRRWRVALWSVLGAAAAMLIIAMLICPTVPVVALMLTASLGGLMLAETVLSNEPKAPPSSPSKPLKGVKAQVSLENEAKLSEWEQKYEELKRRERILKKYKV